MPTSSFATLDANASDGDAALLLDLLHLARATVLLAEHDCDTSGFLRESVLPRLRGGGKERAAQVCVFFDVWNGAPLPDLIARAQAAVTAALRTPVAAGDASLVATLAAWQRDFRLGFVFIFDRFEDFLARPAADPAVCAFQDELVRLVSATAVRANILLSVDEHAAELLAPLRSRVPELGEAVLRLPRRTPSVRVEPPAAADQPRTASVPIDVPAPHPATRIEQAASEPVPSTRVPPAVASALDAGAAAAHGAPAEAQAAGAAVRAAIPHPLAALVADRTARTPQGTRALARARRAPRRAWIGLAAVLVTWISAVFVFTWAEHARRAPAPAAAATPPAPSRSTPTPAADGATEPQHFPPSPAARAL